MPPLPPYNIYREQLTSLFHGHALWEPDPTNLYRQISVGDVGYVKDGCFYRMFNVLLEWNDPSNYTLCEPEPYERLDLGPFVNIRDARFSKGDYYSRYVAPTQETQNVMAANPDESLGTTYTCRRRQGALLTLPQDGLRKDVIRTKVFEDYIRDHIDSWYAFAQQRRLDVERMEDLILVTGCTLVTSWGIAAFIDNTLDAEILLRIHGPFFDWHEIRPSVTYQSSNPQNQYQNQCVFIRGFRAKRVFLWTRLKGAADPLPDDSDDRREDEIEVTRVPDVPNYRDPLSGVLDYLAEKCPDDTVVIAHDDDLQLVEQVETFTADAVSSFLLQNEIGVLVENGAAILHDDEEEVVLDEKKAIFYAAAELEGEMVPLVLHPVLSKYLLKLDITNQPVEHDYDLPTEEITSAASHPPMQSLKLESHQGYPQLITVQASSDSPGIGVTVQDVLRTIQEDVRTLSRRREWTKLSAEERAEVDSAFRERCRTEEELGQGPCRIDYLRGRDRLQVLPKLSPSGEMLPAPMLPEEIFREAQALDDLTAAGPSRIPIR